MDPRELVARLEEAIDGLSSADLAYRIVGVERHADAFGAGLAKALTERRCRGDVIVAALAERPGSVSVERKVLQDAGLEEAGNHLLGMVALLRRAAQARPLILANEDANTESYETALANSELTKLTADTLRRTIREADDDPVKASLAALAGQALHMELVSDLQVEALRRSVRPHVWLDQTPRPRPVPVPPAATRTMVHAATSGDVPLNGDAATARDWIVQAERVLSGARQSIQHASSRKHALATAGR